MVIQRSRRWNLSVWARRPPGICQRQKRPGLLFPSLCGRCVCSSRRGWVTPSKKKTTCLYSEIPSWYADSAMPGKDPWMAELLSMPKPQFTVKGCLYCCQ